MEGRFNLKLVDVEVLVVDPNRPDHAEWDALHLLTMTLDEGQSLPHQPAEFVVACCWPIEDGERAHV
ncbi:MAG: hypothetical protein ABJC62_04520 [Frankiaceae bacterium]